MTEKRSGMNLNRPNSVLGELQRALEAIYGVSAPQSVEDYLVGPAMLARFGAKEQLAEELLVMQEADEVQLALYVNPRVLAQLPECECEEGPRLLDGGLPAFAAAAEGVSHFVYFTLQANCDRAVSLLELETQAEVDKFATALLHLWKHGERRKSRELRSQLFERVGYRQDLMPQERERYALANRLARGYAGFLDARFVALGYLEGLLDELRRAYRLAAASKYDYLAQHRETAP